MGKLQKEFQEIKRKQKIGRIERNILKTIEASGLTLPFDLYTGGYGTKENPRRLHQKKFEFKERLDRLVRKGLIRKVRDNTNTKYELTDKGENGE